MKQKKKKTTRSFEGMGKVVLMRYLRATELLLLYKFSDTLSWLCNEFNEFSSLASRYINKRFTSLYFAPEDKWRFLRVSSNLFNAGLSQGIINGSFSSVNRWSLYFSCKMMRENYFQVHKVLQQRLTINCLVVKRRMAITARKTRFELIIIRI